MYGKKHTEEAKLKISKNHISKREGFVIWNKGIKELKGEILHIEI